MLAELQAIAFFASLLSFSWSPAILRQVKGTSKKYCAGISCTSKDVFLNIRFARYSFSSALKLFRLCISRDNFDPT